MQFLALKKLDATITRESDIVKAHRLYQHYDFYFYFLFFVLSKMQKHSAKCAYVQQTVLQCSC